METQLRVIVFLAFVGFCMAIKCYECDYYSYGNNVGQKNCDDEFKSQNISTRECGGECQKKIIETERGVSDKYRVERRCVNKCEESEWDDIHCCKDEDLCNAASPSAAYSFVFVLVFSVVAFLV